MADNQHIEVINQTPLLLTVEHVRSGKDAAAIGDVAPLEQLVKDIAGDGTLVVRDKASRVEVKRTDVATALSALVVAPGDLRSGDESDNPRPHALTVANSTDHYVDMHYIYPGGTDQWFGPRLAPGQKIVHQTSPHECVLFYSVFTGGLLAATITNDSPASSIEITPKFVDLQHKKANPPPDPDFGEVKLVGQARKPTPPTSKDYICKSEHTFLPSAVLKEEAAFVQFNTLVGRLLRHVTITGVDLRWDGSDTSGLNAYSAVRGIDGTGGGGGNLDIRSLTIHADRVTIAIPLWFPRTDVTIYARELIFRDRGCIETTPYPFKAQAVSPNYMQDENGNVYPADDKGKAVYQGADGRDGEQPGTIELFVRDIRGLDGQVRFIARGSPGQAAEDGGHKPYKAKANQPEDSKDVGGITFEEINAIVLDTFRIRADYFSWPGNARWPGEIEDADLRTRMKARQVGQVKIGRFYMAGADCVFLPSRRHAQTSGMYPGVNTWMQNEQDPGPLPGDGEDAYPSGKPGKGGDGGAIVSHFVPSGARPADVACGAAGPKSKTIEGAKPGETYWLQMTIDVEGMNNPLRRGDNLIWTQKVGNKGKDAEGIAQEQKAQDGKVLPPDNQPALGWLHELSLEALLTYAADAFRKGCNDDARRALEPYYALLTPPDAKAIPDRLTSQWVALNAMRTNLNNNTDYYGNPPGWVPRLAVTTGYATFQAVRQAASQSLFFALKMADDYDALQQADDLAVHTTTLVETELEDVQNKLRAAYDKIGEAKTKLDAAQQELSKKGQELTRLRTRVEGIAKEKIEVRRAFSAACQLFGGLMNICPIGQPVLRGVGNVFAVASEFDWNKPHPWEEAAKTFEKVGSSVTEFMEKNENALTTVDNADLLSAQERRANIGLQLSAMQSALSQDTTTVRTRVADLDEKQRPVLTQEMQRLKTKIEEKLELLKTLPHPEALKAPVQDWARAVANAAAAKAGGKIASDLATYRAQLKQLTDQRSAVMQTVMSMKDSSGKRFSKEDVKTAVQTLTDAEVTGLLAHSTGVDDLAEQRRTAEAEVKAYKAQNKQAHEKKKEVLERLKGLGDGVANIGAAISRVAAPFDKDEPAVKSLAERMLNSKDSEFHADFAKLKDELMQLADKKKRAAENLMHWHQAATALTGRLSGSLDTLDALGRERQSLSGVLDAGTRTFLKGMQQRARAALQRSIYYFVQAYQYEFLADPGDDFFSFDAWVKKLRAQEATYKATAEQKLAQAKKDNASAADIEKARQQVSQPILLGEDDFKSVEEGVLRGQLLDIFVTLLARRESVAKAKRNRYDQCMFTDAMLQKLNATGSVSFNFVRDFDKGTFKDVDLRALDVAIDAFEADVSDRNLSLRIRILHSGESVILDKKDDKPVYYGFRAARHDDPISWFFTWNQKAGVPAIAADQEDGKAQIDAMLGALLTEKGVNKEIQEYKPSLFSDFEFWISNLSAEDGKLVFKDPKDPEKKRIHATVVVKKVVLSVGFQDRTTMRGPARAAGEARATGG